MLGLSSFQVVSIQFAIGTDQLEGAPSDHLSTFVFWYLMLELLLAALIQLISYLLFLSENTGRIPLVLSLLSALNFDFSCYHKINMMRK